jgi:DNA-binding response OmpR family regulator
MASRSVTAARSAGLLRAQRGRVGPDVRLRTRSPYMAQLRRKLEADPARPRHLLTEPGMGYRFVV